MYVLYGGDFTRSVLVQWVLEEGGLPFQLRRVDVLKDEHRTPAFPSLNPSGVVPVLVTPTGEVLTETAALMLFLADRHRLAELAPPQDDPDRGAFLRDFFHVATDIQPDMKRFHFPHRYSPRREDDACIRDMARDLVFGRLAVIEGRLARRGPFLLGARFSMADAFLAYWIAWLGQEAAAHAFPAVGALYARVQTRPRIGEVLNVTERLALAYDAMMEATPGGVIP